MKRNRLYFCLAIAVMVATMFSPIVRAYVPVSVAGSPSALDPSSSTSTFFQLSYPIATKAVYWDTTHVLYSSHLDHTPPFYNASNNGTLPVYTGESVGAGNPNCGTRNGRQYCYGGHPGYDIPVSASTAVYASHAATVHYAGYDPGGSSCGGYGYEVILRDATNPQMMTRYGHLSSIQVSNGQSIARGQLLTYNTGCSSGPHIFIGVSITTAVGIATLKTNRVKYSMLMAGFLKDLTT